MRRQSQYNGSRIDGNCDRSQLNPKTPQPPQTCPRDIGCHCGTCNQVRSDYQEIKKILEKMDTKKFHEISAESSTRAIDLCSQEVVEEMEMTINYTYKDSGRQLIILDLGAPVSLAGISWMEQYLQEFGLTIEHMNCVSCHQLFTFGPSRRYISKSLVEFPILITRLDG